MLERAGRVTAERKSYTEQYLDQAQARVRRRPKVNRNTDQNSISEGRVTGGLSPKLITAHTVGS